MPKRANDDESRQIRKNFATNFASALKGSGMRQIDVARHLGVNANTIQGYLKGRTTPGVENLVKLGRVLRVSVSFLVGDTLGSVTSIETLGKHLADRLNIMRLTSVTHVSNAVLHDAFDQMIGRWIAEHGALPEGAARRRIKRKSTSRRANHLHTV